MNRIEDTFAECFDMPYTRLLVTAADAYWLDIAGREFCGYGTSVIACDAEVGVERTLPAAETPDGRPGLAVLAFAFSAKALQGSVQKRVGQCLMTCPTTAVFNGLEAAETLPLGDHLRFFGDGFQKSKLLGRRRYWRIPVMDGEFIVEDRAGVSTGIAGGNFILQAAAPEPALQAAQAAAESIAALDGCITPFPGGIARSGSKVGSRYKELRASTAEAFCPTLKGRVASRLHPRAACAYEVVIDGVDEAAVRRAMSTGIAAALHRGAGELLAISAGNYGGQLGRTHIHLTSLANDVAAPPP